MNARPIVGILALVLLASACVVDALGEVSQPQDLIHRGNIDCAGNVDIADALLHLEAQAGLKGISAYCSQYAWGGLGCDPGPAPSTNCDYPVTVAGPAPTSVPGGALPVWAMDINCDNSVNGGDVIPILALVAEIYVELPCGQLGDWTSRPSLPTPVPTGT